METYGAVFFVCLPCFLLATFCLNQNTAVLKKNTEAFLKYASVFF